jgi:hypothetical protein
MGLSTKPLYLPFMKIAAITTRIKEMIAEISEKVAKEFQPSTDSNLNQSATIPAIVKSPDITTKMRCIFPLRVMISPPASRGKNNATRTPKNPLDTNRMGPITTPSPLFMPQCNPRKNINNNTLDVMMKASKKRFLGAPTAIRELTSSRI